jgi:class 3 adenylate cyclase/tetratricopeptide (TPR) repeat protein
LLFCDISGSTRLGEHVDAESVRDVMFRYYHAARSAIERHGGTIEKFVGDAVMAVFGVPLAREDDALRAVRAACELRERLAELNDELESRYDMRIAVRIGVNTGEVVAGDATSREMIVTGPAVNIAARLEQHARPNEVLLGEQTYRLVDDSVSVEPVEPIAVRGMANRVRAYSLTSCEPAESSSALQVDVPLIGRDHELKALLSAWERAKESKSFRVLTIVGEPGVGKSRLARELVVRGRKNAKVLEGRCLSYGEAITYWPIAQLVHQAAHIRSEDSIESARRKLTSLLADDEEGALVAERVAQAIGLAEGQAAAEEITWAIRRLLVALVHSERRLILVIDDIQWAESALLDLVTSFPTLLTEAPILCLCLARPELLEIRPKWEATLTLEPLGAEHAAELVPGELAPLREHIVHTAGGNPLFIQELSAFVADGGDPSALPPTLSALLGARLDRLPHEERVALESGSIEGEIFHRGATAALTGRDVTEPLERLRQRGLIRECQAEFRDEAAFRFRHILLRDAAYEAMTKRLRAELHEQFANWLAEKAGDRTTEVEEILGHHLERAYRYRVALGRPDQHAYTVAARASEHLAASGSRALDRGDALSAVGLLERALALIAPATGARRQILYDLVEAHSLAGAYDRAVELRRQALEEARAAGDVRLALRLYIAEAWERFGIEGFQGVAEALTKRTIPQLAELGDELGLGRAWHTVGRAAFAAGLDREAMAALDRALRHSLRAGDALEVDRIAVSLASVLADGPTPVRDALERVHELRDSIVGRFGGVGLGALLGFLLGMEGRFAEARAVHAETRIRYEEMGVRHPIITVHGLASEVELLAGDAAAAEREAAAAFEMFEAGGLAIWGWVAERRARALREIGRLDDAMHFVEIAEREASVDEAEILARIKATRALIRADRGEIETAVADAIEAELLSEPLEAPRYRGEVLLAVAEVLRAAGRRDEAVERAVAALELHEGKGNLPAAANARQLIHELEATLSQPPSPP